MSNSSTVYDCRDTFMNQTNSHIRSSTVDRKAVGGPVDNARSRKCSSSSVLPPQYLRMNSAHPSSTNMISLSTSNNLKFDRSLSEPSDTRMASSQNQLSHINSNKYKTELCRSFDESRQCKYGEKCRYAHGSTELRTPARHPKYKTEPCRTYHSSGFCPYGPRCHFIHNEYERKNTQSPNSGPTNNSGGNSPTNINQGPIIKDNHSGTSSNSSLSPQHSPSLPLFQTQMSQTNTSFGNGGNINFGMRPKSVKFNSLSSSSLGSTADSPPSSVTDSPTLSLSPLFFGEDFSASNSAYTLSSSPSSSSSSSTPLSSSSSSTSISGPTLDGLTGNTITNAFNLLTISECSQDLSTTNRFMPERFLLDEKLLLQNIADRSNYIQNESFFTDKPFGASKFSYGLEWTFGGLPDYGCSLLQTSD